jgi:hypothetical protein
MATDEPDQSDFFVTASPCAVPCFFSGKTLSSSTENHNEAYAPDTL